MQWADYEFGLDTREVTFPVVTVDATESTNIQNLLQQFGSLQVVINPEADYINARFKYSGFFHFFAVLLVTWSAANMAIAAVKLYNFGLARSISSVCLSLEIAAHASTLLSRFEQKSENSPLVRLPIF